MTIKLERYKSLVSGSEPSALEAAIRNLLIHYFFHTSDKQILQVRDGGRTVNLLTPTVFKGAGQIVLGSSTVFGVPRSPSSYSCSYIEARTSTAVIDIGDNTVLNNRATLLSEGAGIRIGKRCLIGAEFDVMDTNAHELALGRRHEADSKPLAVEIGDDVFIGTKVIILKGCRIGAGSVIAAGSVLPPKFVAPPLSIIAGNPAKIIGQVPSTPHDNIHN